MSRRIFPVPLLLLALVWSGGHRQAQQSPGVRPVLTALVLPQLSLECVGAIGRAVRTCSSPSPQGAVVCAFALIEVLHSCP